MTVDLDCLIHRTGTPESQTVALVINDKCELHPESKIDNFRCLHYTRERLSLTLPECNTECGAKF